MSLGFTLLIAPPMRNAIGANVRFDGRSGTFRAMMSMASSVSSLRYVDFQ